MQDTLLDISTHLQATLVDISAPSESPSLIAVACCWKDSFPLTPNRSYFIKTQSHYIKSCSVRVKYGVEPSTFKRLQRSTISFMEYGVVTFSLQDISDSNLLDDLLANPAITFLDSKTNKVVGEGIFLHCLRRGTNITWQNFDIDKQQRAFIKNQTPFTIWLYGLSGSGKSTIANALEKQFLKLGKHTMLLDGDNIRYGLCKNLGFTEVDRTENIRRIGEVARLMNDAGLIVIASFITPLNLDREMVKNIIGDVFEIFVDTPLDICEQRDIKGLYRKARNGEIPNFTGIGAPFEQPISPEIVINTAKMSIDESVRLIMDKLAVKHKL